MKRTTIFIEEGLERELHALARRTRRPMASIVREAVEQYVIERRSERGARLGFIAVGRSGHNDTAEHHEDLLFDDSLPVPAAPAGKVPTPRAPRATGRGRATRRRP